VNLRTYTPNSLFSRYYKFLVSLPGSSIGLLYIVVLNILVYIIDRQGFIVFSSYTVAMLVIYSTYGYFFSRCFKKFKRIIFLIALTESLAILIGIYDNFVGLVSSTMFPILIFSGIDGTSISRYSIAILPAFLVSLIFYGFNMGLLLLLVPVLLDYLIYSIMGLHRINGYKAPMLGTLYLRNYLDRLNDIEKVFDDLSLYTVITPILVYNKYDLIMTYTDIHYGPFSNIGSSMFPSELTVRLNNLFKNVIVFHGMGSHDRDLPSRRLSLKLVDEIFSTLIDNEKYSEEKLMYYGYIRLIRDEWDLFILVFDKLAIIFLSNKYGIDDPSYSIQLEYHDLTKKMLGIDLVIIDCHNHEQQKPLNISKLREALNDALMEIKSIIHEKQPSIPRVRCVTEKIDSPGVVGGKITLVEISKDNNVDRVLLLYVPGNNMEPGLRNKLRKFISEKAGIDIEQIEILTNDEHTETGISSKIIYLPVINSKNLFEGVEKSINNIMEQDFSQGLLIKKFYISTKILSYYYRRLVDLLRKSFRLSSSLIILYLLITPIIITLISMIIR